MTIHIADFPGFMERLFAAVRKWSGLIFLEDLLGFMADTQVAANSNGVIPMLLLLLYLVYSIIIYACFFTITFPMWLVVVVYYIPVTLLSILVVLGIPPLYLWTLGVSFVVWQIGGVIMIVAFMLINAVRANSNRQELNRLMTLFWQGPTYRGWKGNQERLWTNMLYFLNITRAFFLRTQTPLIAFAVVAPLALQYALDHYSKQIPGHEILYVQLGLVFISTCIGAYLMMHKGQTQTNRFEKFKRIHASTCYFLASTGLLTALYLWIRSRSLELPRHEKIYMRWNLGIFAACQLLIFVLPIFVRQTDTQQVRVVGRSQQQTASS